MKDLVNLNLAPALAVPFGQIESAYERLRYQVQEMEQEALEFQGPAGDLNSTATLMAHLAYVDLLYLRFIGGPVTPELDAEYGPYYDEHSRLPRVTGRSAAELLERYERVIRMVREYLATQSEVDAEREVRIPWWPEPASVRFVLWHMASHTMFHIGQIVWLKRWYTQRS